MSTARAELSITDDGDWDAEIDDAGLRLVPADEHCRPDARLRAPNFLGDTQWFTGTVTAKDRDDEQARVVCDIKARNQRDEQTTSATATIALVLSRRLGTRVVS